MTNYMDPEKLVINRKIERWDEGIPLGNGEIGCLLFGSADHLVLSLDRGDIWDRSNSPEKQKNFTYDNLKKWVSQNKNNKLYNVFEKPYNKPTPTKLPTGRIEMNLGMEINSGFSLNISEAEASYSNNNIWLKTYTHATDGVGMIKTNVKNPEYKIVNPKFGRKTVFNKLFGNGVSMGISGKLKSVKYPAPEFFTKNVDGIKVKYFIQMLNYGDCFGIATAEKPYSDTLEIAYYSYYCKDVKKLKNKLVLKVAEAAKVGYDSLFESHKKWWREYNSKSSITVPDDYIQNRYNIGNYLLGCASRKGHYPMPLQGLWSACDDVNLPPWKGDYHNDLNTQMTYYSFLKANRLEQGECFIDYLYSLKERARDFAKTFYNADGICLPSVMDIDGYALGGWAMYSLSPTNHIWLCQSFERFYTFTGDRNFLENICYPFMSESGRFILSMLHEDNDGYYILDLSSSPEIHDNTMKAYLTPNSNYDQALMIYLFKSLKRLAGILGNKTDDEKWSNALSKLRPLAVNEQKVLRISPDEDLTESHRHQSHAMSIHPLRLLDYYNNEDREIIDATIAHAEKLGSQNYTGYSIAWIGDFYAMAKNGDKALKQLEIFWKYFCSVNTFHLNGDYTEQGYSAMSYRPFTLEGNFCAQDVLQEMMLYSEDGNYEIFPAIPKKWSDVSFKTLRGWGGVLVSAELKNSKLNYVEFKAENDVEFLWRNAPNYISTENVIKTKNGLVIKLKKDEVIRFS